ncbi:probable inactive receptor kinase At5g67200 [Impatiens glandulifera]|uniref:probable inactive receptor kinase At5g67200 n=1 Tax=Impatiens glandulifera TaxID=253017 RepID=UPI001FB0F23F|nr:probable inactive receptor kinase At5g67200 [Impatiens glandulifera]
MNPPNFFKTLFPLILLVSIATAIAAVPDSAFPPDAVAILSFKSNADLDSKLIYTLNERFDYCQWQGVKCVQGRVVRFVLQGFGLRGGFSSNTLTRLDQLRVLSLKNNSLAGPIPDLSPLVNLKSLFLDHNSFSGTFPVSFLYLHRLLILDLSRNNISGSIPVGIIGLDRLNYLRLDRNYLNGSIPPLNQSSLRIFNVSGNNLTGPIPVTPTLSHFSVSSFSLNPNLCGEVINKQCPSASPFFNSSSSTTGYAPPAPPFQQITQSQGMENSPSSSSQKKHKRFAGLILGFVVGTLILVAVILSLVTLFSKYWKPKHNTISKSRVDSESEVADVNVSGGGAVVVSEVRTRSHELEMKEKKLQNTDMQRLHKSGNLVFCAGDSPMYSLEQLMKASAELLGRGTLGTTYKALMNNQLVVTVKRLDAGKTAITSSEAYERHMEKVGQLRHPNLVPMRAFFQAKEERLVIYDYQPNGSLFNLIHGSRSTRAKPLHWTSCLKIAEDVAHGLAYIHQSSNLIHGNIKSSNILLGSEFEACTTDYSLSILTDSSFNTPSDPDTESYKAPEARKSGRLLTHKSDVYAFGILLLELLTGRPPSQHPFIEPADLRGWVRAMRDDYEVGENDNNNNKRLEMLVDVASICSLTSAEHRPLMWQVLKMIQDIKDRAMREKEEDDDDDDHLGTISSSSG